MKRRLREGSLCTGYNGLGLALEHVFGDVELAFVADLDPSAAKVLAHRYPGVPNLGDITATDWTAVSKVDILTAGYPCQPFSTVGRRKGTSDERHIWPTIADSIRVLRPGHVFLENVPGHLSLGFGRVLADLASLGYVGSWCCVRASDIGAAHRRERVFIHAHHADTASGRLPGGWAAWAAGGQGVGTPVRRRDPRALIPSSEHIDGLPGSRNQSNRNGSSLSVVKQPPRWGNYAGAIKRWEAVTGTAAPAPSYAGPDGPELAPRFVEWLMGLPTGWVTAIDGISIPDQLHLLGNGVVPQQAAAALQQLLRAEAMKATRQHQSSDLDVTQASDQ